MRKILLIILFFSSALVGTEYRYQVSACLIFQNEADYLKEWIEYHKLIGIEHFYMIDNASSDHFMKVLDPYIKSGEVELFHEATLTDTQETYNVVQCNHYENIIRLSEGQTKWLAIIDADEFIVPLKESSLPKLLKNYEGVGGLYINWLEFGTSHVEKIPKGLLMIECLTRCSEPRALGKSIVRPERVSSCTDPHRLWYKPPYDHVNSDFKSFNWIAPLATDKILVHHYMTRDRDHLVHVKYPRRIKWLKEPMDLNSYIEMLEKHNAHENRSMRRFVPKLRSAMGFKPLKESGIDPGCGCRH